MQGWMEDICIQPEEERSARERFRVELARQATRWEMMMTDPDYLAVQQDLPPHMR
jgi:hypothetical protein